MSFVDDSPRPSSWTGHSLLSESIVLILVFRGGSPSEVAEIAPSPDTAFLQVIGEPAEIGFSRSIGAVDAKYIREHHQQYGGPEPPLVLDHDGIDDAFTEKGSVVWYWHDGRWLRLTGAD